MNGIEMIQQERKDQIEKHGRDLNHDIRYNADSQLLQCAKALISDNPEQNHPIGWEDSAVYKMANKPKIERLAIAAALIAAEIDVLKAST